jgi:hypothetical protein
MENSIAARKASLNESFSVLNFMWTSVRKRLVGSYRFEQKHSTNGRIVKPA